MISNLKSQISTSTPPCDLCGATTIRFVLTTSRLDGPLLRCTACGLFFIAAPAAPPTEEAPPTEAAPPLIVISESEAAAAEMKRLASRAQELALVEPTVEEREQRWREVTAAERMNDLLRVTTNTIKGGRLLEIGSSTGEFLAAASYRFKATGVEADTASCSIARARGFHCYNGTLFAAQFPPAHFDVVTLYHVIEHFPSPQQVLKEIHRILWPKGWLVIETPNINTIWFSLLGARWRQFIPDHRFFFTPETIKRICVQNGFEIVAIQSVSKAMSLRLFISRLGRYHKPTARLLARISNRLHLSDRTLKLNLGDVMRVYARRK